MGRANGVVTYDGKPLAGAEVMFVPVDGGRPARALTDHQGCYVLTTFTKNDGAIVGEHRIVVAKAAASPADPSTNIPTSPPVPGMPEATAAPVPQIPERYGRTDTSGLEAAVKPGDNTINLDVLR